MKFLLIFTFLNYIYSWSKNSWRTKNIPSFIKDLDNNELIQLEKYSPLVFAGECDNLQDELGKICFKQGFLFLGGESNEFSIAKIKNLYELILQIGIILTFGSGLPTTKIGIFSDKIMDISYIKNNTEIIESYHLTTQILNLIRAFTSGGYADINRFSKWNLNQVPQYKSLAKKIHESLKFMKGLKININDNYFTQTNFYIAHNCLLLNYEELLTRIDSRTNNYYDCSTHLLWLDDNCIFIDNKLDINENAYIEFISGINNPIAIKLSEKFQENELIELINKINPSNLAGKIILITCMDCQNLKTKLPLYIKEIEKNELNIVWCCDPIISDSVKIDAIKNRLVTYFNIHNNLNSYPGGLYLKITEHNKIESLEIAFLVSELLGKINFN